MRSTSCQTVRFHLTEEILSAKKQSKAIFRKLAPSDERESLLRAIGRLGVATLKQKVRHRASIVMKAAGERHLLRLDFVCDCAVEARNHFVHGSDVQFHLGPSSVAFMFLTETLEFIFVASEFVEFGWDIHRIFKKGSGMSHPFGAYIVNYWARLRELEANCSATIILTA